MTDNPSTSAALRCCCDYDPPGLRCIPCLTGHHDRCTDRENR